MGICITDHQTITFVLRMIYVYIYIYISEPVFVSFFSFGYDVYKTSDNNKGDSLCKSLGSVLVWKPSGIYHCQVALVCLELLVKPSCGHHRLRRLDRRHDSIDQREGSSASNWGFRDTKYVRIWMNLCLSRWVRVNSFYCPGHAVRMRLVRRYH